MLCSIDMPTQISGVLEAEVWDEREKEMASHLASYMQEYREQPVWLSLSVLSTLHCTLSRRGSRILAIVSMWI